MSNEEQSRRGFLKDAGLAAGGLLGGTVLPALRGALLPAPMPAAQRFQAVVDDPVAGEVRWRGTGIPAAMTCSRLICARGGWIS